MAFRWAERLSRSSRGSRVPSCAQWITLHIDAMVKGGQSSVRNSHRGGITHEAALVAAITILDGICEPNGRRIVIAAAAICRCFQETRSLGWVDRM